MKFLSIFFIVHCSNKHLSDNSVLSTVVEVSIETLEHKKDLTIDELFLLCAEKPSVKEIAVLLNTGDINATSSDGWSSLMMSTYHGCKEISKYLIKNGADVNISSTNRDNPPLLNAIENGHIDIVKLLIENDANINIKDSGDWTPLIMASFYGHLDIIEYLLENGADINSDDTTAIDIAREREHFDIVEYLEYYLLELYNSLDERDDVSCYGHPLLC